MTADVRSAIKQLRRQPTFVLGATLSLAIGMAVATAVFSLIDAALLSPMRQPGVDRLAHVWHHDSNMDLGWAFLPPNLIATIRSDAKSFDAVAVYAPESPLIGETGGARRYSGAIVSTNYFDVLGIRPMIGRTFEVGEGHAGNRSVLVSHSYWRAQLGENPRVVGLTLRIDRRAYTIVGVMPPGFDQPRGARVWLAMDERAFAAAAAPGAQGTFFYNMVGRLSPGVSLEQASAEVELMDRRLASADGPAGRTSRVAKAMPYTTWLTLDVRSGVRVLAAATLLILIVCAVNFATMSLARGMKRRAEIALRVTIGASKARIVRMLLAEALVLSVAGGVIALLLAWWFVGLFTSVGAELEVPIRWPTILFGMTATILVGFLFALAPALELARVDLRSALAGVANAATGARGRELRGRRALVALQLSLALTGIAVVTALLQSYSRFDGIGIGFDPGPLVTADAEPQDTTLREHETQTMIDRVAAMPGVTHAGASRGGANIVAWTDHLPARGTTGWMLDVTPAYFAALGVTPLHGRLPTAEEISGRADVVMLARGFAHYAFGTAADAVGGRVRLKTPRESARWYTVIGVLPDIGGFRLRGFGASIFTTGHKPFSPSVMIAARTTREPQALVADLQRIAPSIDPTMLVSGIRAARDVVNQDRRLARGRTIFLGSIAALAILLAVIGVFGLTSYTTELRARELAIRTALGARAPQLLRVVVSELWWMSAVGIVIAMLSSGRLVAFLDAAFRNPMSEVPLVRLAVAPTVASAATLLTIMAIGTIIPLRRILRLDVMRTVQGS